MVQTARADVSSSSGRASPPYERHRPERSTLYEVVRDNLETLYGAIDEGALEIKLPKHARRSSRATSTAVCCAEVSRGFGAGCVARAAW